MITEELLDLLPKLASEDSPIPVDEFSAISDMNREDFAAFLEVWGTLSINRKRALIEVLGKQADEHIELNFELINRTGLSDDDEIVRRIAIRNLWECKDPDLIEIYLRSLSEESSSEVRIAAADALGRYVLLGELEEISPEQHREIEDALISALEEDAFILLQQSCIEALGYSSRAESERIISRAYESEDPDIRKSAVLAMGRSYNQDWEPQVLQEMTSHYPGIRTEAARAAGELELRTAVDALIELLEDVHTGVQQAAIWSLGQIGGNRAEEALIALQDMIEEEEMLQAIEDALDHLAFLKGSPDFALLDFEGPDLE
jgi:HEAT repeat protein